MSGLWMHRTGTGTAAMSLSDLRFTADGIGFVPFTLHRHGRNDVEAVGRGGVVLGQERAADRRVVTVAEGDRVISRQPGMVAVARVPVVVVGVDDRGVVEVGHGPAWSHQHGGRMVRRSGFGKSGEGLSAIPV